VQTGHFPTADAMIANALEAFITQQADLPTGEELKRLIAEGESEADRGELLDGEEVFRELLPRNAERLRES
jgi:predicted transcriptional regulator